METTQLQYDNIKIYALKNGNSNMCTFGWSEIFPNVAKLTSLTQRLASMVGPPSTTSKVAVKGAVHPVTT